MIYNGAEGGSRTLTGEAHTILSRTCMPIPPLRHCSITQCKRQALLDTCPKNAVFFGHKVWKYLTLFDTLIPLRILMTQTIFTEQNRVIVKENQDVKRF